MPQATEPTEKTARPAGLSINVMSARTGFLGASFQTLLKKSLPSEAEKRWPNYDLALSRKNDMVHSTNDIIQCQGTRLCCVTHARSSLPRPFRKRSIVSDLLALGRLSPRPSSTPLSA